MEYKLAGVLTRMRVYSSVDESGQYIHNMPH